MVRRCVPYDPKSTSLSHVKPYQIGRLVFSNSKSLKVNNIPNKVYHKSSNYVLVWAHGNRWAMDGKSTKFLKDGRPIFKFRCMASTPECKGKCDTIVRAIPLQLPKDNLAPTDYQKYRVLNRADLIHLKQQGLLWRNLLPTT